MEIVGIGNEGIVREIFFFRSLYNVAVTSFFCLFDFNVTDIFNE